MKNDAVTETCYVAERIDSAYLYQSNDDTDAQLTNIDYFRESSSTSFRPLDRGFVGDLRTQTRNHRLPFIFV